MFHICALAWTPQEKGLSLEERARVVIEFWLWLPERLSSFPAPQGALKAVSLALPLFALQVSSLTFSSYRRSKFVSSAWRTGELASLKSLKQRLISLSMILAIFFYWNIFLINYRKSKKFFHISLNKSLKPFLQRFWIL